MRGAEGGEWKQNVMLRFVALLNEAEQHVALNLLLLHCGTVGFTWKIRLPTSLYSALFRHLYCFSRFLREAADTESPRNSSQDNDTSLYSVHK